MEERFFWIFGVIFLIDIMIFPQMESWGGPVALLILEIFALIIVGRKCGVDDIRLLTDRALDAMVHHAGRSGKDRS